MCTTCNVALNIAESPQADRQRAFIRGLIAQGLDKQQIKAALVAEYGEDVLALPEADGFGWTAYAIPFGLAASCSLGGLALLLPSWRRRSPAGIGDERRPRRADRRRRAPPRRGPRPLRLTPSRGRYIACGRADAEQVQRARDRALRREAEREAEGLDALALGAERPGSRGRTP